MLKKIVLTSSVISIIAMPVTLPFVAEQEGLVQQKYLDVAGIPTWCYGETEEDLGKSVFTKKECTDLLRMRLGYFSYNVDKLVEPMVTPQCHAAMTSLAYNIGIANFSKSTLLRKVNTTGMASALPEFNRWVFAKGKVIKGLQKRREKEKQLCASSL